MEGKIAVFSITSETRKGIFPAIMQGRLRFIGQKGPTIGVGIEIPHAFLRLTFGLQKYLDVFKQQAICTNNDHRNSYSDLGH